MTNITNDTSYKTAKQVSFVLVCIATLFIDEKRTHNKRFAARRTDGITTGICVSRPEIG